MTSRRLGVAAALVDGSFVAGDVRLEGGLVAAVGLPPAAGGGLAAPGLVDLQVNGYAGVDFLTSEAPAWHTAERALARAGVTAYVANLITARSDATAAALRTTRAPPVGRTGGADPGAWARISRGRSSHRPDAAPTRNSTCVCRRASSSSRCSRPVLSWA
jgi:hypothetical protein